jgi:ABC-2 type transport system permease protein
VIAQHFQTFVWLRWRLFVNQLKRGGIANLVILALFAVAAVLGAVGAFIGSLLIGFFVLDDVAPAVLLYVWDGIVVVFLFSWMAGLMTELQRSDSLTLDKFLHLPVSLSSAFLLNYLSSLPSLSFVLFVPLMLGLSLGLLLGRGLAMLWLLPMLVAFLLMVTAITYQFQGWLATLMANPRRRRTIIVVTTMIFILLCQTPNLINILQPWNSTSHLEQPPQQVEEQKELLHALSINQITYEEYKKRQAKLDERHAEMNREFNELLTRESQERIRQVEQTVRWMNLLLPPGWLPAGVEAAAEGQPWIILLGIVGPSLLGTASLWRAYRTTVRLYRGEYTSGKPRTKPAAPAAGASTSTRLLEKRLPWLSEQASVIALAAFRSLLRAPEAKMLLLTPPLLLIVFGSMFLVNRTEMPQELRPMLPFGAMAMILFSLSQLIGNQFGFDRNGFRVFVLCPARRRDILLGKNLAVAPLALGLGAAAAVFVQVFYPLRLDHFLALVPRFVSMYLLYCLPANLLSIFAPMRIAAGSFKAAQPSGIALLWQLLFMFLCPSLLALTLLPVGVEWALEAMDVLHGIPLDLLLSLLECAVIVYLYYLVLRWQGDWLQAREQRILQIVTTKTE